MKYLILLAFICFGFSSLAELSKTDEQALQQTKDFLNNKAAREAYLKNNPDAQKYVDMLKNMNMSEAEIDQVFRTSSEVLDKMARDNNGDSQKMQQVIDNGMKSPEQFYKALDPKVQEQIKALGERKKEPK